MITLILWEVYTDGESTIHMATFNRQRSAEYRRLHGEAKLTLEDREIPKIQKRPLELTHNAYSAKRTSNDHGMKTRSDQTSSQGKFSELKFCS